MCSCTYLRHKENRAEIRNNGEVWVDAHCEKGEKYKQFEMKYLLCGSQKVSTVQGFLLLASQDGSAPILKSLPQKAAQASSVTVYEGKGNMKIIYQQHLGTVAIYSLTECR